MPAPTPELVAAARRTLHYLATVDPTPSAPADAILGFGMFDLRLPVFCGELHRRGLAPRLIFTGGIGAGTGNLGRPEADAWHDALRRARPEIPATEVILENRSTQTAENIRFTTALLEREHPALAFGRGIRRVIVVASPSRLRRVGLTLKLLQPGLEVCRQLPPFSLESEWATYGLQGIDYVAHLAGELDRLVDYPARGWIAVEPLPPEIAGARDVLRRSLAGA